MLTCYEREKLLKLIQDLKKNRDRIAVEGKRDSDALQKLGIQKKRIVEMSQLDIPKMGHELHGRIIDLIDTDKKGKQLTKRLHEHTKLTIDNYYKKRIFRFLRSRELEDLWDLVRKNFYS